MPDLDLEVMPTRPEEEEMFSIIEQHHFEYIGEVTSETKYKELNMFSGDRWKGLRYYLDEMLHIDDIQSIEGQHYRIVNELTGLGVFTPDDVREFDQQLIAAHRLINLSRVIYR